MAALRTLTLPRRFLATTVLLRDLPVCWHRRVYTLEPCPDADDAPVVSGSFWRGLGYGALLVVPCWAIIVGLVWWLYHLYR